MNEHGWDNSRHIASATGVAYQILSNYLKSSTEFHQYQPITVVTATTQDIINGTFSMAKPVLEARNSYWFVSHIVQKLTKFGCVVKSFIQTYGSGFVYITAHNKIPKLVSWDANAPANSDVYKWYTQLQACFTVKAKYTVASKSGAELFIESIQECYLAHSYAYIYASPTSVHNITLLSVAPKHHRVNTTSFDTSSLSSTIITDDIHKTTTTTNMATVTVSLSSLSPSSFVESSEEPPTTDDGDNEGEGEWVTEEIVNTYYNTPQLIRFPYNLPPPPKPTPLGLSVLDYLIIIAILFAVPAALVMSFYHLVIKVCTLTIFYIYNCMLAHNPCYISHVTCINQYF